MNSLISPENTWMLLAVMCASVAASIYLEQTYAWASKVSGAVIALILALVLVNVGVLPTHAPLFDDIVWGYAVPMAIPLLLLQANMTKIWRETGRMLFVFLIGSAGTICGALLGTAIFGSMIDGLPKVAAMMTGSYIGGGVNFVALADAFKTDGTLVSSTIVADNLTMAVYFLVLLGCVSNAFFRRYFTHPHIDAVEQSGQADEGKTLAAAYWSRKDISLRDIAVNVMYAAVVVTLSKWVGSSLSALIPADNWLLHMANTFFGSEYVWITFISMIVATFFDKKVASISGAQEIGTYFIYLFFFVIGCAGL